MQAVTQKYKTYNYSATRCYVITLTVSVAGYLKIEKKLPSYLQNLKGIYVSVSCLNSAAKITGFITLNFNGNSLKVFQAPVYKTILSKDCALPYELNETILPGSFLQGFYYDIAGLNNSYPYTLTIYLHYKNPQLP